MVFSCMRCNFCFPFLLKQFDKTCIFNQKIDFNPKYTERLK